MTHPIAVTVKEVTHRVTETVQAAATPAAVLCSLIALRPTLVHLAAPLRTITAITNYYLFEMVSQTLYTLLIASHHSLPSTVPVRAFIRCGTCYTARHGTHGHDVLCIIGPTPSLALPPPTGITSTHRIPCDCPAWPTADPASRPNQY